MEITKERRARIEAALKTLLHKVRAHSEFYRHDPSIPIEEKFTGERWFRLDVCFDKTGREIFVNPHLFDSDFDYPELVGRKILAKMIRDSAHQHNLRMTKRFQPLIVPSEKGWVEVGFKVG